MSCTNCNENNSIPLPVGVTDPCNPCTSPCNACGECTCTCSDPGYMEDGCYSTQGSSCVTYEGDDITCATITKGSLLTLVIQKLFNYTKNIFTRITSSSLVITRPDTSCDDTATIELVPSTDANNALIMGTDGHPYVPVSTQTSPALVLNDSTSIDFTQTGTLGHTATAVVKISSTANNIATIDSNGLFVNGAVLSPILTFDNGLFRSSNNIQFGTVGSNSAPLLANTSLEIAGFTFEIKDTNSSYLFANNRIKDFVKDATYKSVEDITSLYQRKEISLLTDYTTGTAYNTRGWSELTITDSKIGFYYPTAQSGSPASVNPLKTSYLQATDHTVNLYGNKINRTSPDNTQTAGGLVSGEKYTILSNAGSADFTGSGAANNTVGTTFISNGVTPNWGTGSLKLVGAIKDITNNVVKLQEDDTYSTIIKNGIISGSFNSVYFQTAKSFIHEISDYADRNGTTGYYANTQIVNTDTSIKVGFKIPTRNDATYSLPALDAAASSILTFTSGLAYLYSANTAIEGLVLIKHIGVSGTQAASAILDVQSTTKGFAPPRMTTTQRNAIASPDKGIMVYDITLDKFYGYNGSWVALN